MRHNRNVTIPASIKPKGDPVIVNFCGTLVSDIPIAVSDEKKIMDIWYWDYGADEQFKDKIY